MKLKRVSLLLVAGISFPVFAMNCQVTAEQNGFVLLDCDGKTYHAVPQQSFKQMVAENSQQKQDIEKLKQQLAETSRLVADQQQLATKYRGLSDEYADLNKKFDSSLKSSISLGDKFKTESGNLISLTDKYKQLVDDYDKLAEKYRQIALNKGSSISFDLGIGLTDNNGESEAAGLIGMNISDYHIWGFIQSDNSGLLVGKSFDF